MKAGGIVMLVLALLLLAGSTFYGIYSVKNAGAADRLGSKLGRRAGFIVAIVERKAEKQRNLALGLGIPGVLLLGGGIFMLKKGKAA